MVRRRAEEREALHEPWPTPIEIIAAEFPDWDIGREVTAPCRHGSWRAQHITTQVELCAPTPMELLDRLRAHHSDQAPEQR